MTTTICRHHWRIAEPDSRVWFPATCINCGATRMMTASSYTDRYDFTIKGSPDFAHPKRYQCSTCGEEYNSPASVGKCKRSHQ